MHSIPLQKSLIWEGTKMWCSFVESGTTMLTVLYGNQVDPVQSLWRFQNLVWNGLSPLIWESQQFFLPLSPSCQTMILRVIDPSIMITTAVVLHNSLDPNWGGGGGAMMAPPSTYRAITRQRAKLSPRHFMTIFFRVSRTFWYQICDSRGYGSEVT